MAKKKIDNKENNDSVNIVYDALFQLALQFTNHISIDSKNGVMYIIDLEKNDDGFRDKMFTNITTRYALITNLGMIVKQSDDIYEIVDYIHGNKDDNKK